MARKKEEQLAVEDFTAVVGGKPQATATRLAALGHYVVCSRCGGCGRHSFNLMDGDRCFKCRGSGKTIPRLTAKLLDTVRAQMANGELEPYLAKVRKAQEAKRMAKKWFDDWRNLPTQRADDEWKQQQQEPAKTSWTWSSYRRLWQNAYCSKLTEEMTKAEWAAERGTDKEREEGVARLHFLFGLLQHAEDRVPPHLSPVVTTEHPDGLAVMADGARTAVADMMTPQVSRALVPYGGYGGTFTTVVKAKESGARPRLTR